MWTPGEKHAEELTRDRPGVTVNLTRDFTQYANVIYGSGTTVDGAEWSRQSMSRDNRFCRGCFVRRR